MTTNQLEELIERIGKATGPDREIDCLLEVGSVYGFSGQIKPIGDAVQVSFPSGISIRVGWIDPGNRGARNFSPIEDYASSKPYTSSIDAALGLVERLLPGFDYILEHTNGGLTISCLLGTADPDKRVWGNTIPLAIVAATLRAIQSTKTGDAA